MQAIILAAGMGKRLGDLTRENTKCMVKVNGVTLIERMLSQLDQLELSKIIIVIGYKGNRLCQYIESLDIKTPISFVKNEIYDKTNNIYSLYLAKEYLASEDTLLLESDLIFESAVLTKLVENPYPYLALVAKFENWMNGTVVTLDEKNSINSFLSKTEFVYEDIPVYYKTVNIYKFSKEFSANYYIPALEVHCKNLGNNEYYEQVLKVITLLDACDLKALVLNNEDWYEIDDIQDLDIAESIFSPKAEKLQKIKKRFGGYWRYPQLIDFKYLVNPYFPNQNLMNEIKVNFERLLTTYPSGMEVNSLLAATYFNLRENSICVGNGAAELIKSLMTKQRGKIGMVSPGFQEYPNRTSPDAIINFIPDNNNLSYSADDLINHFSSKDINSLIIINPDNPSGNFIEKTGMTKLLNWTKQKSIDLIIDESFVDFADTKEDATLLEQGLLDKYPNLIVLKSISKSFGVPGIRLGVLAGSNKKLISDIKKDVSIWNINSFGEFYLQIIGKYKKNYIEALELLKQTRCNFYQDLKEINSIRAIPSQANYIMFEIISGYKATSLAEELLDKYNILVKDLSKRKGLANRQYIRVAVKKADENKKLIKALNDILK